MIQLENLTKNFGSFRAVDHISFSVAPGEVLGFLGPNGAGKSTTMKMITGFLTPSSGSVRVFGDNIEESPIAVKQQIGYLPEGAPSYGDMTVLEFLEFIADMRELKGAKKKERINTVIDQIELAKVKHQAIETLSKGFKRRVGLAQAILHDPKVLILDEPTDGLDPNQKHQVRQLIQSMAKDKIIIISTHILEEVSAVCTRAIIIDQGRIIADGSPAELEAKSKYHGAVMIRVPNADSVIEKLKPLPKIAAIERENEANRFTVIPRENQEVIDEINDVFAKNQIQALEVHVERGRLDDVFRTLTGGEVR